MSLAKLLMGASASITVTGTLTGSGTLNIPQGVGLVTLTGAGGAGGDNSWYDPGQPYIAASGYHAAVAAQPAVYGWGSAGSAYAYPLVTDYPGDDFVNGTGAPSKATPSSASDITYGISCSFDGTYYHKYSYEYSAVLVAAAVAGSAAYYDNPGQPYIAPSSGGGPYSGPNTTATLNSVTDTWAGGYGAGVVGTVYVQTLASTGAGQSLTYSVGAGGSLSYSYTY